MHLVFGNLTLESSSNSDRNTIIKNREFSVVIYIKVLSLAVPV